MIRIEDITESIESKRYRITDHAEEEAYDDRISLSEILNTIRRGEILEQYPDDKPYPSCLVFGRLYNEDIIHTVWAFNELTKASVLITTYRPDPRRWIDGRIRRQV